MSLSLLLTDECKPIISIADAMSCNTLHLCYIGLWSYLYVDRTVGGMTAGYKLTG